MNGATRLNNKLLLFFIRFTLVCPLVYLLASCNQEKIQNQGDNMGAEIKTLYLKSKISDQELPISLPACILGLSHQNERGDKIVWNSVNLRLERLAFSKPKFDSNFRCETVQQSKEANIYAISPLSGDEENLFYFF